ncbi:MAG: GntR family transcriptional regulator, partial [Hungatella sp.]
MGKYCDVHVLNEKLLMEEFGVSKSPVREALIELCNEGVLRNIPRYGYEIICPSEREVAQIRDYRILLECGALNQYWDMITKEDCKRLAEISDQDKHGSHNSLEHWRQNSLFHLELISCYQNDYLYQNLKSSLRVLSRAYAQFHWDTRHKTAFLSTSDPHSSFLFYIKEGNKKEALECLKNDICAFENDH